MLKKTRQSGFTLIELLVVISIIGLLASIVLASLISARDKARDVALISEVRQQQTVLALYYTDNNGYPSIPDNSNFACLTVGCEFPGISASLVSLLPQHPSVAAALPNQALLADAVLAKYSQGASGSNEELTINGNLYKGIIYYCDQSSGSICTGTSRIYYALRGSAPGVCGSGAQDANDGVNSLCYQTSGEIGPSDTATTTSNGGPTLNTYYDYNNSCASVSISDADAQAAPTQYYSDQVTCQNDSFATYYDTASSCSSTWITNSQAAGNTSEYFSDYNACQTAYNNSQNATYYDLNQSCFSVSISPNTANSSPSQYFSDYNSCENAYNPYGYYYDLNTSCVQEYIPTSQGNSSPGQYFSDYNSCQTAYNNNQYSYYYDYNNSCNQVYISAGQAGSNPSEYYSDSTACQTNLSNNNYGYYYDVNQSCNSTYISNGQAQSSPSQYFSDYWSCQNQLTQNSYVYGCTDSSANNYNPSANQNDGSCTYYTYGCTDPNATNYNPAANYNDGSCTY
jgi:prepilin-type N-terminal cleavage/methylation domain-containing protein